MVRWKNRYDKLFSGIVLIVYVMSLNVVEVNLVCHHFTVDKISINETVVNIIDYPFSTKLSSHVPKVERIASIDESHELADLLERRKLFSSVSFFIIKIGKQNEKKLNFTRLLSSQ